MLADEGVQRRHGDGCRLVPGMRPESAALSNPLNPFAGHGRDRVGAAHEQLGFTRPTTHSLRDELNTRVRAKAPLQLPHAECLWLDGDNACAQRQEHLRSTADVCSDVEAEIPRPHELSVQRKHSPARPTSSRREVAHGIDNRTHSRVEACCLQSDDQPVARTMRHLRMVRLLPPARGGVAEARQ